jgi:excisionase family DNA binding protein
VDWEVGGDTSIAEAIVNRPEPFVAEVCHWASRAFADGTGERRPTDPYHRPMPVMWSCPDPNCPPTAITPVDVPDFGEEAGAESERFTTDEVAALLNVPRDTIDEWHQEGTGLRVIRLTRRAITEGAMSAGGWPSKG